MANAVLVCYIQIRVITMRGSPGRPACPRLFVGMYVRYIKPFFLYTEWAPGVEKRVFGAQA